VQALRVTVLCAGAALALVGGAATARFGLIPLDDALAASRTLQAVPDPTPPTEAGDQGSAATFAEQEAPAVVHRAAMVTRSADADDAPAAAETDAPARVVDAVATLPETASGDDDGDAPAPSVGERAALIAPPAESVDPAAGPRADPSGDGYSADRAPERP